MELSTSANSNYASVNRGDETIWYKLSLTTILRRFSRARKCVSSKSAWVLLVLSLNIVLLRAIWYPPYFILSYVRHWSYKNLEYSVRGILKLIYPLAGIIADTKIGRLRIIRSSTIIVVIGMLLAIIMTVVTIVN